MESIPILPESFMPGGHQKVMVCRALMSTQSLGIPSGRAAAEAAEVGTGALVVAGVRLVAGVLPDAGGLFVEGPQEPTTVPIRKTAAKHDTRNMLSTSPPAPQTARSSISSPHRPSPPHRT